MKRILFGLVATAVLFGAGEASAQQYQVVVNAGAGMSQISTDDLSKIFRKKSRNLPSGEAARPVDQDLDASVREAFSQAVIGRSAYQMQFYWSQLIFSGKEVPPETKGSDADVLAYVAANAGAIGYVSRGASVGAGVRVVRVLE